MKMGPNVSADQMLANMNLEDLPKDDDVDVGDNLQEHVEESNAQQDGDQIYKGSSGQQDGFRKRRLTVDEQ